MNLPGDPLSWGEVSDLPRFRFGEPRWEQGHGRVTVIYRLGTSFEPVIRMRRLTDDPLYPDLWPLDNTGQVINGFSELMRDVFGQEQGIGARSALGTNVLPGNIAVEIELIIEITAP